MIEYRKASINDAAKLAKIRSEFFEEITNCTEIEREKLEAASKNYFDYALADDSFVAWLAVENGKVIATSGLCFYMTPPSIDRLDGKVAYIMNMYTFPEYRKNGIAKELFTRIIEEAKKRGYCKLTLNATGKGKPLYEEFGFKDVKGDMVFYAK